MEKRKRKTGLEQYYTPERTVIECLSKLNLENYSAIIEPSAGTGNFLKHLPENTFSFDIDPKCDTIEKADFLTKDLDIPESGLFVGNPPFGRACSLAVKFFNKCASYKAQTIAFILPKSFRKWTIINRLNLNYSLTGDWGLNVNYVDENNNPLDTRNKLNTVFQIWERTDTPRQKIAIEDRGFIWKSSIEEADVAITLFGYSCGKVFDLKKYPEKRVKNTCNGFFQVKSQKILDLLPKLDYNRYAENVSYTKALSIAEIRSLLNEEIKET